MARSHRGQGATGHGKGLKLKKDYLRECLRKTCHFGHSLHSLNEGWLAASLGLRNSGSVVRGVLLQGTHDAVGKWPRPV